MKKRTLQISWREATEIAQIPASKATLLAMATQSLQNAYAPYSNFLVGAAVLLENGVMLGGSNQENAAYPMCLCAERVAISAAASAYPNVLITSMAITVKAPRQIIERPAMPCGACRQALCELENRQKKPVELVIRGEVGPIYLFDSVKEILPFSFDATFL
ncbi:MAG: cytidine deaminase [Bacteroidota bacterium]